MNDNTILRIKVPAHLYESVKKQLTLTEAKKGGKAYGDWTVVKEKKAPKDGMEKVEEMKDGKKDRSLDELKKAKAALDKKIEEMESSKDEVKEGEVSESVMSSVIDAMQGNPEEFIQSLKLALNMSTNEFQNFLAGLGTLGTVGALATNAAIKDKKANQKADQEAGSMEEAKEEKVEEAKEEEKIEEKKEARTTIGVWSEPARDGAILKLIRTIDPDAYYSSVGGGGTRDFYAKGKPEVYKKLLSKYGTKIFRIS